MKDTEKSLRREMRDLRRTRDEIRLQAHLGRAELRERIAKLEAKWPAIEAKLEALGKEGEEAVEEIARSAKDLIAEVRRGYEELRRP